MTYLNLNLDVSVMVVGRVRIALLLFASQNVTRYNQKSLKCSKFLVVTKKKDFQQ